MHTDKEVYIPSYSCILLDVVLILLVLLSRLAASCQLSSHTPTVMVMEVGGLLSVLGPKYVLLCILHDVYVTEVHSVLVEASQSLFLHSETTRIELC